VVLIDLLVATIGSASALTEHGILGSP